MNPLMSSASVEWYTPPHIIERVVRCLGEIDLDPCAEPDKRVPAHNHYTAETDGLNQNWYGKVFMNPPYGRGQLLRWVMKLTDEWWVGNVTQAIVLIPARTDTKAWGMLSGWPVCFVRGRLSFNGGRVGGIATFPSAIIGVGINSDALTAAFEEIGTIYAPY